MAYFTGGGTLALDPHLTDGIAPKFDGLGFEPFLAVGIPEGKATVGLVIERGAAHEPILRPSGREGHRNFGRRNERPGVSED